MTEVNTVNKLDRNFCHLIKYHTDDEYRQKIISRAAANRKHLVEVKRYNHYKKLSEDIEYLKECKNKGLRIRNCPEEFLEKITQSLELFDVESKSKSQEEIVEKMTQFLVGCKLSKEITEKLRKTLERCGDDEVV
jgi:signal recognition particle GTPase